MYIIFDIGGSKIRVAASSDGKKFGEPLIVRTPQDFKQGIKTLAELIAVKSQGKKIKAVAGGTPGYYDVDHSQILGCADNIKNWIKKPLKSEIQKITHCPVYLDNDASMVGLGEAVYGAGKGYSKVVYLTVSTGVGGGRIINGQIDSTIEGREPGNQLIDLKNFITVEDIIGGHSIEKKYHKKPYEILDKKFWDSMAQTLAFGLNNTIVHWVPDVVVVGGSMMKKIGIKIPRVKFHLNQIIKNAHTGTEIPVIKKATLGDFGGLYGALALINQELKK